MVKPVLKRFDDFLRAFSDNFVDCMYNKNIDKYVTENNRAEDKVQDSLLNFAVRFRQIFNRNVAALNIRLLEPKVKVFIYKSYSYHSDSRLY
jgi:hypothetical protein